jgi:2'-hydroxyisoflavone reductase
MPVWIPPGPQTDGFHQRSIEKAKKAGLTTRPLEDTVRDTLAWFDDEYLPQWKQRAEEGGQMDPAFSFGGGRLPGITRARESALLEDWQRHLEAEGSEG